MSLADLFLADLEDIEGLESEQPVVQASVPGNEMIERWKSLIDDPEFTEYMSRLEASISGISDASRMERSSTEYALISDASKYIPLLDDEINRIYKLVAEIYARRFPELEQIVAVPLDFLKIVHRLQTINSPFSSLEMSFFSDIVPANQAVAIAVTASTSRGLQALSPRDSALISSRLESAFSIGEIREKIICFLTSVTPLFAPNLSNLIGPFIASQLIAAAGGLESLASMPAQNIEAVGGHRQALLETSLVIQTDIVQSSPAEVKKRAIRLVVGKASICARMDRFGSDRNGETGNRLKAEIEAALEKSAELPPARAVKPLALPEIEKTNKSRRGGRRARAWKEKYGLTDIQKRAGRLQFGGGDGDLEIDGTSQASKRIEMEAGRIRAIQPKQKKGGNSTGLAFTSEGIEISLPPHNS